LLWLFHKSCPGLNWEDRKKCIYFILSRKCNCSLFWW
jgi:hypothetical protein